MTQRILSTARPAARRVRLGAIVEAMQTSADSGEPVSVRLDSDQ